MNRKHNRALVPFARQLRREMTKEERKLWYDFLRGYPVKFTRQKIFGNYILDSYCASAKLVVELDGSQHFERAGIAKDAERTAFLEGYGLSVLRIANNEVMYHFPSVCEYIDETVKRRIHAVKS